LLPRGTIVEGYRIDGVLGEGGMGVVYRATQLSLNRVVALKLLTPEFGDDPGFRTRFQREGQLQAALDHQHIVTVYEAGQSEQGLFLAIRLIEGPTLKDLILGGQLNPRRTLRLLAQVAQALDVAHDAGLIHRDIKPQNILIGKGDHVYLADFGLIKAPDESSRLTGTGQFIGTIDYVSPEQIQGDPATGASDIYALAAVLYECLTGQVPFPRPNEAATIHAHVMAPAPKVTDHRGDMPAAIDGVIARGMSKEPTDRPVSASELIREASLALASAAATGAGAGQETRLRMPSDEGEPPAAAPTVGGQRDQRTHAPGGAGAVATAAAAVASAAPGAPTHPSETEDAKPGAGAPAAAPSRPRDRPRSTPALLVAAVLAVIAIAIGFVVGHSGKSSGGSAFASFASVGHLQLHYPSNWQLSSSAPTVPGMHFSDPVVITAGASHGRLNAGEVTDAGNPTLLSPGFRARVQGSLPTGEPVALGSSIQALRYTGLQVSGLPGPVTVYAVPTTSGVATIACWSTTPPGTAFQTQCGRVAETLRLVGASPIALGADPAYAKTLSSAFDGLRSATRAPLAQLRSAKTPSAQAAAASQLSSAYTAAAAKLDGAAVPPMVQDLHARILADLRRIAAGYTLAASAARAGKHGAYAAASRSIDSASASLSAAIASLAKRGYGTGGG
jgi:hypothetical protein